MTKEEKRKWAHALVDKICDLNEQGEHYASIEFATDGDKDLYISVYAKEGRFSKTEEFCLCPRLLSECYPVGYYEKIMLALDELYKKRSKP